MCRNHPSSVSAGRDTTALCDIDSDGVKGWTLESAIDAIVQMMQSISRREEAYEFG
jgi:hypothetical protein